MGIDVSFDQDGAIFKVLVNHEEQYSIWPDWKPIPAGWREAGHSGDKPSCLDYIEKVWTDLRPLSLRQKMAGDAGEGNA
jgi:MbtH protein